LTLAGRLALSAAAIAALLGLTVWQSRQRERAAETAYPPEGTFLTVEGVRMHVVVAGTGPDLVLIHGSSGSTRDWTFSLLPRLAERYRVIAIDRPGLGWSDPAPGGESLHVQARLIRGAAAALGASRPVVVGQSYGGAVALAWATDAPESLAALVTLAAPSHRWEGGLPLQYVLTSAPVFGAATRHAIMAWVPEGYVRTQTEAVFAPQAAPEGYVGHFGPRMSLRPASQYENARQRAALKDEITAMVPRYARIAVPVEVLHGTADTIVSLTIHAEPFAAEVPFARLTRLPGLGHMLQHVAQDDVAAAIDRATARAGLR
jgi:pimeloyl-ACP methyl ester carboxylesterase